jgi:hypothetical protein
MAAIRKKLQEDEEAEKAKKETDLQNIASLEKQIEVDDANEATPRPSRPKPIPRNELRRAYAMADIRPDTPTEPPSDVPSESEEYWDQAPSEASEISETEQPAKKKAKQSTSKAPKAKVRDTIQALRKESDSIKINNVDQGKRAGPGAASGPGKKTRFGLQVLVLVTTAMLTLDKTTLFYWSLYSHKDSESGWTGVIVDWNTGVNAFAPPPSQDSNSKTRTRTGSRAPSRRSKSQVPALTDAATHSSRSVLTDTVMITSTVPDSTVKPDSELVWGGLINEDETTGAERDAAVSSPVKGHARMTSTVSSHIIY